MTLCHKHCKFNNQELIVFMPSVRSKKIYPYYPRIAWAEKIKDRYDSLYIADPFQDKDFYQAPGGSWFFDENGANCLPEIAKFIKDLQDEHEYKTVIIYGSSMGGYAGIVLGSILRDVIVIAECPQIFLDKHPGSKFIINNVPVQDKQLLDLTDLVANKLIASKVKIICNTTDSHRKLHIAPLMALEPSETLLEFLFYSNKNYKKGHTALAYSDFVKVMAGL